MTYVASTALTRLFVYVGTWRCKTGAKQLRGDLILMFFGITLHFGTPFYSWRDVPEWGDFIYNY